LQDLHAADRVAIQAWWDAQQLVVEVRRRSDRVRDGGRQEQARLTGGMTARQLSAGHRAVTGVVRPTSAAGRRRHLRLAAVSSELAEAQARTAARTATATTDLAAAESSLADAAATLAAQMPWAAELAALASQVPHPDTRAPKG
jgi:hypothetical protein